MGFEVSNLKQKVADEVVRRLKESEEICRDINMAYIPAGSFKMGSEDGEGDERPVRDIYVSGFCADRFETTNPEFEAFLASRPEVKEEYVREVPEKLSGPKQPAVYVSWEDADTYCKAQGKRLPTEAEWEKMAKGGINATYATADTTLRCGENANCDSDRTTNVDAFLPNAFGIYGLTGGVREWVGDRYWVKAYAGMSSQDPTGSIVGEYRVERGGSWNYDGPNYLRAAFRFHHLPHIRVDFIGVRCVRSVQSPPT